MSSKNVQGQDYIPGEILVQLKQKNEIDELLKWYDRTVNHNAGLNIIRPVVPQMNLWLLEFDTEANDINTILHNINRYENVIAVQKNHKIHYRNTIPNDPLFNDQWQLLNDGVNGILADADIDADEAWDSTTGGITALGDTIVVCIIDDGIDSTHEDFEDNLWKNNYEIPKNGIDDDNNGYVDDRLGWNVHSGTDDVFPDGNHGTPVAGIVGAKGNNNTGVTGINWNIKLMIVVMQGASEANALSAYAYPLVMRKMYNESGGNEGAFVVATNSSWGIDFGQPATAPLWCNMYDTLGKYGVLSCGATINGDENVDLVGDLPTACPSKYLISVTNMNSSDNKVIAAGYGQTHIDLGAHGQGVYTTADNNGYGNFGGTSGATPHVTGAVALLYSMQCPAFANYTKAYPDSAAILIKDFILSGVDTITSLIGITVTGGRLNLYKSILKMRQFDCSPADCFPAFLLEAKEITDSSALLDWKGFSSVGEYSVYYGKINETGWDTVMQDSSQLRLTGLEPCTDYGFTLIAHCDTISAQASSRSFKTDGCCIPASKLEISFTGTNDAIVSWKSVIAAVSYNLRYRENGTTGWTAINVSTNTYHIFSLNSCTDYEVQVASICIDSTTGYSPSLVFQTSGCLGCNAPVCESFGMDASDEWIEQVSIGPLLSISGNNNGYKYFNQLSPLFEVDSTYNFTLTPGFDFIPFDEYWRIWIDYNQDGVFTNPDELAFDPGMNSDIPVTGSFTVPSNAKSGPCRMRISMRFNNSPSQCMQFDFGEVEDYCIEIDNEIGILPVNSMDDEILIYPNPVQNIFKVEMHRLYQTTVYFELYDNLGRMLNTYSLEKNGDILQIDLSEYQPGLYILKTSKENSSRSYKLIKQ